MIASVFKSAALLLLATSAIHAMENGLMDCAHDTQLRAANDMCSSHGLAGSHIACLCQAGAPLCLSADMVDHKKPEACNAKTAEACARSCSSKNMIAIKCEGKDTAKCVGIDPKVKKGLLSQL